MRAMITSALIGMLYFQLSEHSTHPYYPIMGTLFFLMALCDGIQFGYKVARGEE